MSRAPDTRETVRVRTREEWRAWLEREHATSSGAWLVFVKKGRGDGLSYDEAVEEALCFGWIDSKVQRLDDVEHRQLYTPRRRGSVWSRANKERCERLLADGSMTPAGLRVVEAAQADGSWSALDSVDALEVPDDLAHALAAVPAAQAHYERFPASAQRAVLWWVASARRPETRARRVAESVRLAAENRRLGEPGP